MTSRVRHTTAGWRRTHTRWCFFVASNSMVCSKPFALHRLIWNHWLRRGGRRCEFWAENSLTLALFRHPCAHRSWFLFACWWSRTLVIQRIIFVEKTTLKTTVYDFHFFWRNFTRNLSLDRIINMYLGVCTWIDFLTRVSRLITNSQPIFRFGR